MKLPILLTIVLSASGLARGAELRSLSRRDAEARALQNHPRITIAELRKLVAQERVVEARSAFFPNIAANGTVVGTGGDNERIAAGGLNNPVIYDRGAVGFALTWQLFDFGRAANLLGEEKFRSQAESKRAEATREQIILLVDLAYFSSLQADSVLQVAKQTEATRKTLRDQVAALTTNNLKSELDLGFAETALAEAQLLVVRALNDRDASLTRLKALMGETNDVPIALSDETNPSPPRAPATADALVRDALARRPDLEQARLERQAAEKHRRAERALLYPTLSAMAATGIVPEHNARLGDDYMAAGLNLNIPLFDGLQRKARASEASLQSRIAEETLIEKERDAIRDVRLAWLSLKNALDRQALAAKVFATASRAYALAESKYQAGASSMVELSQAQLSKTSAAIAQAAARYEVLIQQSLLDYQTGALESPPPRRP